MLQRSLKINYLYNKKMDFPFETPFANFLFSKKRVSFNKVAQVVLIPSRIEYQHFKEQLWYTYNDYLQFNIDTQNAVAANTL